MGARSNTNSSLIANCCTACMCSIEVHRAPTFVAQPSRIASKSSCSIDCRPSTPQKEDASSCCARYPQLARSHVAGTWRTWRLL